MRAQQSQPNEDAQFIAGAALAVLHPIATSPHPLTKLLRQRLALTSAEAIVAMQGRSEDAATLRDHLYLTKPGDDPGPAGRVLEAWRALAKGSSLGPRSLNADWPVIVSKLPGMTIDAAAETALYTALSASVTMSLPVEAVAGKTAASLQLRPDSRPLALWLGDAALASCLKWPAPVPILAPNLKRESYRFARGTHEDALAWRNAIGNAIARGALVAFDLYADLARRAEKLLAAAPTLRGRDADETVLRLLSEDALSARAGKSASDRSSRRLFERLVELGAVRELTGRSSFRLYGL